MSSSSTISPDTVSTPRRKRRRVNHYFWVREADMARAFGLGVRFLCGQYGAPDSKETQDANGIEVVGGLMPVSMGGDCKKCVAALERAAWEAAR